THFVVTSRRVIYRSGVISKSGIEIPLDRISNVLFHQRIFERMLGAGDLTIESAGESGQQNFANVRKPDAVQNEINHAIEAQRKRRMSPAAPGDSIPVQIEKLAELRDSGAITQAEYASSKADLLKKLK
ncbi:MAG: PH domain-containing protein, partial [Acidimicrobiales bacterium]